MEMTKFQMMFLFFSVLFLTVKICFMIANYFITKAIAERALKKREIEAKVIARAEAQKKRQEAEQKVVNLKSDMQIYASRRNRNFG